jgi:hypothetical protein
MKYNFIGLTLISAALCMSGFAHSGAQGGPKQTRDTVTARSSDNFIITFVKDRRATIHVSGDGSTDLDCDLYDSGGHLILFDNNPTDECHFAWEPLWTGKFKVVIRNLGSHDNEYSIQTN